MQLQISRENRYKSIKLASYRQDYNCEVCLQVGFQALYLYGALACHGVTVMEEESLRNDTWRDEWKLPSEGSQGGHILSRKSSLWKGLMWKGASCCYVFWGNVRPKWLESKGKGNMLQSEAGQIGQVDLSTGLFEHPHNMILLCNIKVSVLNLGALASLWAAT